MKNLAKSTFFCEDKRAGIVLPTQTPALTIANLTRRSGMMADCNQYPDSGAKINSEHSENCAGVQP